MHSDLLVSLPISSLTTFVTNFFRTFVLNEKQMLCSQVDGTSSNGLLKHLLRPVGLCHPLPKHLCAASPRCLPNAASLYNSCHVNHDLWGSLTDIPNCRHVIGCYWQLQEGRISGREDQRDEDQQCTVSRSYGWVMQLTSFSSHSALPARQAELLHPEC